MRHARKSLAVTAVVIAALFLTSCSSGADSVSAPKPSATSQPSSAAPKSMAGVDGPLAAGRWIVPMWGNESDSLPRAEVQVPEGFGSPGGWVVDRGADGDPENYGTVSFWSVSQVFPDPCDTTTGVDPGPGVRDLARALAGQRGTRTTTPSPVTFDGHEGLYLEISFPKDVSRMTGCPQSAYHLWRTDGDGRYGSDIAGTVSRVWILDVDGTRVAMVADTTPHEDAAATVQVLGIARSAHFIAPAEPGTAPSP